MKVKICGITNLKDALLCQELGADALGFIFYNKSKRFISADKAAEISKNLSPFIMKVGVFVNESAEVINQITKKVKLNAVQLHGEEEPEFLKMIPLQVIKSFRINNGFDFSILHTYPNAWYLLDSFSETAYGGTGKSFNWDIIPEGIRSNIILAGGVSSVNIEEIYYKIKPAAVDVSSSLETEPGKKDIEKVKQFFKTINHFKPEVHQPPAERR
jgi:phosphoribosylanthranilate isomerase